MNINQDLRSNSKYCSYFGCCELFDPNFEEIIDRKFRLDVFFIEKKSFF